MQQETPQTGPEPTLPAPSLPPQPPQAPQQSEEHTFYQPQTTAGVNYGAASYAQTPLAAPSVPTTNDDDAISWDASEYIHNEKGSMWLVGLGIITLIAVGVAVWLGEWTFAILVVVMAVAMGVFAFRPPHVLHYFLDDTGVEIAGKHFYFKDFRAFGVLEDGAFYTMTFIPVKRFAPALSVYFAEAQGEQIVDIVGAHLPMEDIKLDIIDNIMRRLRF